MQPADPSPYATKDPQRHADALARIDEGDVHEFYHPFVMLRDTPLELVRVISPAYGAMDMILLLQPRPIQLYVNDDVGARFMKERFPDARTFRAASHEMRLVELDRGATMLAELRSREGPIRELSLVIKGDPEAELRIERYEGENVWDSPFTCHGIDLRQAATARGILEWADGRREALSTSATIFRGSYGKLAPMRKEVTPRVEAQSTH